MNVVIGIDVGGSTTKIVGFAKEGTQRRLIQPLFVRAADPVTSIYGAFGKFTDKNSLTLSDIEKVLMTGVGSSYIKRPLYDLTCDTVPEFKSTGLGGLYLSGLERAVVVSMGTGTAVVYAQKGEEMQYLGGTGVGGGTVLGLARKLLNMDDLGHLQALAAEGNLHNVDLRLGDITRKNILPGMPAEMTVANFGKLSDIAERSDVALGIFNMVFETIGMVAMFAARSCGVRDIVLTGNLATLDCAKSIFATLSSMFDLHFIIPENAQFATVIGTALCG